MTAAATTAAIKKVAANGVRIICEPIPAVRSVAVGVWCHAGVVTEPPAHNGICHLLEHMLFKGTAGRSAVEIAAALDGVGGALEGFTETENVVLYAHVLYEHLPLALDVLSDMVLRSTVPPGELAKEKNVVAEEIRLYEDSPDAKVHDLIMRALRPDRPIGMPVLGSLQTVAAIGRDDIQDYRRHVYTGDRIVIAAAGYFEAEEFVATAQEYFAEVNKTPDAPTTGDGKLPSFAAGVAKDTEQTHLCVAFPGLPFGHQDRYVFAALTTLLGGNTSSRLFQKVREERGLAYAVFAYGRSFRDSGALVAYAGTKPETAVQTRDLILAQCRELGEHKITADELSRTREYLKGTLMLSLESTAARTFRNARHEVYLGRYVTLEETLAGVEAVTAEDILRLAGKIFTAEATVAAIGPNGEELVNL